MSNPFTAVGLKNVSPATPAPAIFVNDIPGVSSELATALKTADAPAALAVWEKVRRLGLDKLSSMVENELSKSADFVYSRSQSTVWMGKPDRATISMSSLLQGVRFTVDYQPYLQLNVDGLFAEISTAATLPIVIIDLKRKAIIATTAQAVREAGEVGCSELSGLTFDVPMHGLDLFIGIDPAGLTLTELGGPADSPTGTGLTMTTGGQIVGNLTESGFFPTDTRVWFSTTLRNSFPGLIRRYADRLGWAYAYVCASLLMSEKLASPNFNLYTNTNRAFTEEQIPALLNEAVTRVRPIARDMLKELSRTDTVTPKADGPYDAGYSVDSYC